MAAFNPIIYGRFWVITKATPAILYFLDGEAEVQLGEDRVNAQPGSFVYMPPMLTHGISAKSPVRMLLIQIKAGTD